MKTNWTNDDRAAFYEWTRSSLGAKALRYLNEGRPEIPDTFELNSMAIAAAEIRGYEKFLKRIDDMTIVGVPQIPPVKFVEDLEKD
jgi:hypothetical protein